MHCAQKATCYNPVWSSRLTGIKNIKQDSYQMDKKSSVQVMKYCVKKPYRHIQGFNLKLHYSIVCLTIYGINESFQLYMVQLFFQFAVSIVSLKVLHTLL